MHPFLLPSVIVLCVPSCVPSRARDIDPKTMPVTKLHRTIHIYTQMNAYMTGEILISSMYCTDIDFDIVLQICKMLLLGKRVRIRGMFLYYFCHIL